MKTSYLNRMKEYLKEEYDDYVKTLEKPMYKGLSVNTLKCKDEFVLEQFDFLEKSQFSTHGYTFDSSLKLGNHWTHLAGLYYLQEPSASSVVEAMEIQEGDWVFDACAAPGGKSHQIASCLNHTGFLLSNEIDSKRANILMSNLERCGVSENMITSSSLEKLCPQIQGLFDKVLLDAPCSGEGMMKKHDLASTEWSVANNVACGVRQLHLLEEVCGCLKKGGILMYSTCTYAIEENEAVIYDFLHKHPEFELVDVSTNVHRRGLAYQDLDISKVRRIFPMDGGEGHFFAKLRRIEEGKTSRIKTMISKRIDEEAKKFLKEQLDITLNVVQIKDKVYAKKGEFIQLDVPIVRQGILVGEVVKKRFEPHHHFYMSSMLISHYQKVVQMDKTNVRQFLSGNVFPSNVKGFVCCQYQNIPLGFGKGDGNMIKNRYPKGLRTEKAF